MFSPPTAQRFLLLFLLFLPLPFLTGCNPPAQQPQSQTEDASAPAPSPVPPTTAPASAPASVSSPVSKPVSASAPTPVTRIEPAPGVVILPAQGRVELAARTCLTEGWLEQIACGAGTREHEALVVPLASAREIHTALLLAGHESGAPGQWRWEAETLQLEPPTGSALEVLVRLPDGPEIPIWEWVRDPATGDAVDGPQFIFAGSRFETVPELGEIYLAEHSGSIIGLVTFGDEVIGCATIFSSDASLQEPAWEVFSERVPPYGTEVTLIIQPAR